MEDVTQSNNLLDMTIEDFKIMSVEALQAFLSLRRKSVEGDFDTLVSR